MKRLKEDSPLAQMILKIEKIMDENEIQITGNNLRLVYQGTEFRIGRDSDTFPRFVEEPFYLEE
jgi:hypothetical protein